MKNIKMFLVLTVITAILFIPAHKRLCIETNDNGKVIKIFNKTTHEFVIGYTHSVNQGRVRDFYSILPDGTLCLTRTAFVSYGAGIAEPLGQQVFSIKDDTFEISNINMELKKLVLQTGKTASHNIESHGSVMWFNDIVPVQTRIAIKVNRVSYYDMINTFWRKHL